MVIFDYYTRYQSQVKRKNYDFTLIYNPNQELTNLQRIKHPEKSFRSSQGAFVYRRLNFFLILNKIIRGLLHDTGNRLFIAGQMPGEQKLRHFAVMAGDSLQNVLVIFQYV